MDARGGQGKSRTTPQMNADGRCAAIRRSLRAPFWAPRQVESSKPLLGWGPGVRDPLNYGAADRPARTQPHLYVSPSASVALPVALLMGARCTVNRARRSCAPTPSKSPSTASGEGRSSPRAWSDPRMAAQRPSAFICGVVLLFPCPPRASICGAVAVQSFRSGAKICRPHTVHVDPRPPPAGSCLPAADHYSVLRGTLRSFE